MNYFITVSDMGYVNTAEKLFESLAMNSVNKIIYYTIDFNYDGKFDNVIPIRINSRRKLSFIDVLFSKPEVCQLALKYGEHNYMFIDSDCLALKNCDKLFDSVSSITAYPLTGKNCHHFMGRNGRGGPLNAKGEWDYTTFLEYDVIKLLNYDIHKRLNVYRQSNVILFNRQCKPFLCDWREICSNTTIIKEWEKYAPLGDETILNCLLWERRHTDDLGYISINIPSNVGGVWSPDSRVEEFVELFNHPTNEKYRYDVFCLIPGINEIGEVKFLHGKTTDSQFNIIKEKILK